MRVLSSIRGVSLLLLTFACSGPAPVHEERAYSNLSTSSPAPTVAAPPNAAQDQALKPGTQEAGFVKSTTDQATSPSVGDSVSAVSTSMLIRTGQASIEVTSVDTASAHIRVFVQQLGGYVANTTFQGGKNQIRSATLELKVPAARFNEVEAGLHSIGTVESVNVTAEDVGEEFVDVTARLANARKLEQRLLDLLAQRTGKLSDVLEVEKELSNVREGIERYEGRLRYLKTRAATSTMTVLIHEREPVLTQDIGHNPIAEAFKSAWRNLVDFTSGFIALMGYLIPLTLIAIGVFWLVKKSRSLRG